jgi:hypothetical protein
VSRVRVLGKTIVYENRTKSAHSGGVETKGPRERISDLSRRGVVRRFSSEAMVIGLLFGLGSQQRMLVAEGLAEGEELGSNILRFGKASNQTLSPQKLCCSSPSGEIAIYDRVAYG